jgi:hypothetical protein
MARLAAIAGIDVATMSTVWPTVGKKFNKTRAGLINKRMQEHRRNYAEFRRRQSEGGRKGATVRWKKPSNIVPFRNSEADHG